MRILLATFFLLIFYNCQSKWNPQKPKPNSQKDYVLEEDKGIFVEVFNATSRDPNRYTENNTIYREDTEFIYSFKHIDPSGNTYFYRDDKKSIEGENQWSFVPIDSVNSSTVQKVKLSVKYGLEPMIKYISDYNQTLVKYEYPNAENKDNGYYSLSGIIENEKNIWIHPPRDLYFEILELNPFPFVKKPYKIGNKWTWQLTIGASWANKRWKTWEGQIINQYEYKIVKKSTIKTAIGDLDCFIIESKANSRIGETRLTSYFNEKYGFVKLEYTNIDNSKTLLKLIEYKEGKTESLHDN